MAAKEKRLEEMSFEELQAKAEQSLQGFSNEVEKAGTKFEKEANFDSPIPTEFSPEDEAELDPSLTEDEDLTKELPSVGSDGAGALQKIITGGSATGEEALETLHELGFKIVPAERGPVTDESQVQEAIEEVELEAATQEEGEPFSDLDLREATKLASKNADKKNRGRK